MSRNPLTLKQRLAALAAGPSAASPPLGQDHPQKPPATRRRSIFNAPWARRQHGHSDSLTGIQYERDRLQEVMGRMIYQAGVDFETRPMVVLNASALPDPRDVSYDLLLTRIISYLDLYVESDYTVVFFAAGGKHTPGWNWIWKAYRSLHRSYRKNLKSLYIIHSSFFSKMLFSFAGAMISPKFFRKLHYIDTLSELAYHVPLTQIDIPPAVYQENLKYEKEVKLPMPTRRDMFGVPLEELMGWDAEKGGVPRVVKDAVQYMREAGLEDEGLFRRSPNSALLRQVQEAYDRGHVVNLHTIADPHLAAVLIKKYLRDLPDPVFPESLYSVIRRCPRPTDDPGDVASVTFIRETLLPQLPHCTYVLLSYVLHLMHEVSLHSTLNRMDAHNLTIVLGPNLIKSSNPIRDVQMCAVQGAQSLKADGTPMDTTFGTVLRLCIHRYYECFEELPDRTEAVAPVTDSSLDESASSSSLSSSVVLTDGSEFQIGDDHDDEDDMDDAVLVMPIGPSPPGAPPSAWGTPTGGASTFKPRHRSGQSKSSTVSSRSGSRGGSSAGGGNGEAARSMYTAAPNGGGSALGGTQGKSRARSLVSVDRASAHNTLSGRTGSISVGRGVGTFRSGKAAGAGVSAIGVTASGFFTPPSSAPAVPKLDSQLGTGSAGGA